MNDFFYRVTWKTPKGLRAKDFASATFALKWAERISGHVSKIRVSKREEN